VIVSPCGLVLERRKRGSTASSRQSGKLSDLSQPCGAPRSLIQEERTKKKVRTIWGGGDKTRQGHSLFPLTRNQETFCGTWGFPTTGKGYGFDQFFYTMHKRIDGLPMGKANAMKGGLEDGNPKVKGMKSGTQRAAGGGGDLSERGVTHPKSAKWLSWGDRQN